MILVGCFWLFIFLRYRENSWKWLFQSISCSYTILLKEFAHTQLIQKLKVEALIILIYVLKNVTTCLFVYKCVCTHLWGQVHCLIKKIPYFFYISFWYAVICFILAYDICHLLPWWYFLISHLCIFNAYELCYSW